jgi:hypothetical protein
MERGMIQKRLMMRRRKVMMRTRREKGDEGVWADV